MRLVAGVWMAALAMMWQAAQAAAPAVQDEQHWVVSWGTAQLVADQNNALPPPQWRDGSLRQVVRVSLPGAVVRVRLSNVFGAEPMTVDGASLARSAGAGKADVDAATLTPLTFAGRAAVTIPAGAEYYSDPVTFAHGAGSDLAVTLYFKSEPARQTGHPGSRATSFTLAGKHDGDALWPDAGKVEHWYALADIEVRAPRGVAAVAAIGDSITDGHGATTDGNDRWTDALATRLGREGAAMGVLNVGIGGGRMLRDGLGPNLVSRFERDVLARSGVTHAVVMIGVNDLGSQHRAGQDTPQARAALLDELKAAHRQLLARAHARGVCVIGGTITPYTGSDYYKPGPLNEEDRQALNHWIRTPGLFDGVADFDAALRDPAHPERLRAAYDKGDGLHPSPAGFRAMADAVPLAALRKCEAPQ